METIFKPLKRSTTLIHSRHAILRAGTRSVPGRYTAGAWPLLGSQAEWVLAIMTEYVSSTWLIPLWRDYLCYSFIWRIMMKSKSGRWPQNASTGNNRLLNILFAIHFFVGEQRAYRFIHTYRLDQWVSLSLRLCLTRIQTHTCKKIRYTEKKAFVTPTKSFVKIGITKIFCYNKMFSSINKTFGCCRKIFGWSNKKFISRP